MLSSLLVFTNPQKVLAYLIQEPGKPVLAGEIQAATKVSKAGVHAALAALLESNLVIREKRGNAFFYRVEALNNPLIKQLKIIQTLVWLQPLLERLKKFSKTIILFGSCARGEDTPASDVDLFIVTDSDEVEPLVARQKLARKVQCIIKTPLAFVEMEKKDREFLGEVTRGLVLWEEKE